MKPHGRMKIQKSKHQTAPHSQFMIVGVFLQKFINKYPRLPNIGEAGIFIIYYTVICRGLMMIVFTKYRLKEGWVIEKDYCQHSQCLACGRCCHVPKKESGFQNISRGQSFWN